jgi:hypothetical protein
MREEDDSCNKATVQNAPSVPPGTNNPVNAAEADAAGPRGTDPLRGAAAGGHGKPACRQGGTAQERGHRGRAHDRAGRARRGVCRALTTQAASSPCCLVNLCDEFLTSPGCRTCSTQRTYDPRATPRPRYLTSNFLLRLYPFPADLVNALCARIEWRGRDVRHGVRLDYRPAHRPTQAEPPRSRPAGTLSTATLTATATDGGAPGSVETDGTPS